MWLQPEMQKSSQKLPAGDHDIALTVTKETPLYEKLPRFLCLKTTSFILRKKFLQFTPKPVADS